MLFRVFAFCTQTLVAFLWFLLSSLTHFHVFLHRRNVDFQMENVILSWRYHCLGFLAQHGETVVLLRGQSGIVCDVSPGCQAWND